MWEEVRKRTNVRLRRNACFFLCICVLAALFTVPAAAAEKKESNVVRVGWYEDSYHITGENGERTGYGYEYEQAVAAYTGWQYEYIKGDWTELLEMLQNGEIDLMGAISYTDERAQTMLFSDLPMGEEKYYLYADLTNSNISASDLTTLNGKQIVTMEKSVQATQFQEWEDQHGVKTKHINVDSFERAKIMAQNHEIDGVISTETPAWVEADMSAIAEVGGSGIYYGINKNRPELKEELDDAMRKMEYDKPFYSDELYKKYLSAQSVAVLSGEEKQWLEKHGAIRLGYYTKDSGVSSIDSESGKLIGVINDYVEYAADCLNNDTLDFDLIKFDSQEEQIQALKNGEIDMIFHASQSPYAAEQAGLALSNTVMSPNLAAVTAQSAFDESAQNRVAVQKDDFNLKWYLSYNYPAWQIIEYDSFADVKKAIFRDEADCFLATSSQVTKYIKDHKLHGVFLTKPDDISFAVNRGDAILLSILNKTLKTMPSAKLTGALSVYDNTVQKITLLDFIKDNLLVVTMAFVTVFLMILVVILELLRKTKQAAERAQILNEKLENNQQELQVALLRAEDANTAKTSFLFNMSHDIRTPMNAILGFTELAEKNSENHDLVKDYLHKIQISGTGLLSILDNVLELSRIESGKTTLEETPQEAGKIFDSCMVMMNPEIEKRHHIVTTSKEILYPYIYFDAPRITEIILNLLSNAIKYTADGGTIHCDLKQSPHPQDGWMYQELSVTDSGIGMSEEFQKHIFENFARERSTTLSGIQGTGLGMGIVKKLIDLMDGTIAVKSKLGEGSTVSIKIPMRVATLEDTLPKHCTETAEKEWLRGKRILLAEDNDLNAEIATALLEEEGVLVERVSDGVQCVEKIERCKAGYYALILMDIQMPSLDGYRATEKIRKLQDEEKANIPIIAMTANAFSEDKARAIEAGMDDHVAKPIDMDVLTATMLKYL